MSTISTITTGGLGVAAIEAANALPLETIADNQNVLSLVLQAVISIVTLIKLLKKPKGVT